MSMTNGGELHYYSDRLKLKLNHLCSAPGAVVEAPSGCGKTTAIRDFLESALPQGTPICWFTGGDEAPAAGFQRLFHEIETIDSRAWSCRTPPPPARPATRCGRSSAGMKSISSSTTFHFYRRPFRRLFNSAP